MDEQSPNTPAILKSLRTAARHVKSLESIKDVMLNIVEKSDPTEGLRAICAAGRRLCGAQYVLVQGLDRSGKYLTIAAHVGLTADDTNLRLEIGIEGISGRAIREERTQNVPDVSVNKDFISKFPKVRSALAIPLSSGDRPIGVFNLESTRVAAFSPDRQEEAETLGRLAAVCIDRKIRREHETRQLQVLEILHQVDSCLVDPTATLDDALRVILEGAIRISHADCGFVQIKDSDTNEMVIRVVSGGEISFDKRRYKIGKEGITGRVAQTLTYECLPDVTTDPTYIAFFKNILSELTMPLVYENGLQGVLDLNKRQTNWFTAEDIEYLKNLSQQAVVAMVLAQHKDRTRQLAALDAVEESALGAVHYLKNRVAAFDSALQNMTKELARERLSPEGKEAADKVLKRLRDNVDGMNELCRRILQPEERIISKKEINLGGFVKAQADSISGVSVEVTGPDTEIQLLSAPDVLAEIVHNLTKNAIEAVKGRKEPKIILRYGLDPQRQEAVFIEVADNGKGIAPSDIGKIFVPFRTTKLYGSGLGLAISYRLVKRLGGTLAVSSVPEKGAVFTVTIPLN